MDAPEKLNTDPYGAWFVKLGEVSGKERLIDAQTYRSQTE